MDDVFDFEEVWVIKENNSFFNPSKAELFTDYDEAVFRCEAMEHKAIIEWQQKNIERWEYQRKIYKVITLDEAFSDYGEGERESSYDDGYSEGVRDGRNEGYEEGYSEGENSGRVSGFDEGHKEGYDEGYKDGKAECGE